MSKATLLELADRVEKASGPDRELDVYIHFALNPDQSILVDTGSLRPPKRDASYMPLKQFPLDGWEDWEALAMTVGGFPVTASLDAAMMLVPDGHLIVSLRNGDLDIKYHDVRRMRPSAMIAPHGFMVVEPNDILKIPAVSAETLPLALTAAALRARAQQESSDADQ